ncbi:hypothetical protein A8C56_13440 [Niabella ginsenosidivorans]|uniref:BT-3987-like N-terminal domain-containing protein n=1 Tax=Niabella ginsenosidivorans TaxID=1176587 RepID=A0A1A9I2K1_9BACT|nr:DUF1735 domain-containing protein [Niabella ginsenosidivorans]ANH81846.1 hypothetical protein A8C56_13440 [Niabella ginsenosidivorans]
MKNKTGFVIMCIAALLASCDKYHSGISDPAAYSNVYMPRAVVNNPYITGLPLADTTYTFPYSAYLGGPLTEGKDLTIRFDVNKALVDSFNLRHNTTYELLPAGSYQFEKTAVISSGQRSTPALTLHIKTGDVNPFQAYMLPLGVTDADGQKINKTNGTTYYIFTRSYMAAIEERQQALSLGDALDWNDKNRIIMARGTQNTLVVRYKDNTVHVYTPNADGTFAPESRLLTETWPQIKWPDAENLYYINETDAVIRNTPYWAGLFYMQWKPDLTMQNASPEWTQWWLGDFWDKYTTIIPFKNYFLLVDKSTGDLLRQPLLSRVEAAKTTVGTGFANYRQVLAWGDYLLALEQEGNLWLYKMAADAVPGDKILVGTGWNQYEKIAVIGKDILALDTQGDVYRYKFDPTPYLH